MDTRNKIKILISLKSEILRIIFLALYQKRVLFSKKVSEILREYDLEKKLIYNWIKKYGKVKTESGLITNNDELLKLRKENMRLQEEKEILKKAMVIFTKKQKIK